MKPLKQVLHGILPLIRLQHILPKDSSVLKAAIHQGLLQKEMPLDIGEGERQQRSSWIRVKDDRKYVKPRLFAAYVDEAKAELCIPPLINKDTEAVAFQLSYDSNLSLQSHFSLTHKYIIIII